jgi:predicted nuclease with TOPRIM domain
LEPRSIKGQIQDLQESVVRLSQELQDLKDMFLVLEGKVCRAEKPESPLQHYADIELPDPQVVKDGWAKVFNDLKSRLGGLAAQNREILKVIKKLEQTKED